MILVEVSLHKLAIVLPLLPIMYDTYYSLTNTNKSNDFESIFSILLFEA